MSKKDFVPADLPQHGALKSLGYFQPDELVKIYQVIKIMEKEFPVQHLCEHLQVSRSAYYDWKRGKSYQMSASKQVLNQKVKEVFDIHKRRYGSPGLLVELQANSCWPLSDSFHHATEGACCHSTKEFCATYYRQSTWEKDMSKPVINRTLSKGS